MAYLTEAELNTYYPDAAAMSAGDRDKFLGRANGFAGGVVGGPLTADQITKAGLDPGNLKNAVSMAFEILSEGETGQVNLNNGNVTEAAPTGQYVRRKDPLNNVITMLRPFADLYDRVNSEKSDRGISFL